MNDKTFKWDVAVSAPKGHPVHVIGGILFAADESRRRIPEGHWEHSGWGITGEVEGSTPSTSQIPRQLEILWYSLMDDRFYVGEFSLPFENLVRRLDAGDTQLLIGLAPAGQVTLWTSGSSGLTEIAAFSAEIENDVPWDRYTEMDRREYVTFHRKQLLHSEKFDRAARQ